MYEPKSRFGSEPAMTSPVSIAIEAASPA